MKKLLKIQSILLSIIIVLIIFIVIQYLWKGDSSLVTNKKYKEIVAHRGIHLNYQKGVYHPVHGCEAKHIFPPSHNYIENTVRSIKAAFECGATVVEIDIRKTSDNDLVIFHDYMLDCRTDGKGLVAEHTVQYLKALDIGYGYTPDNGKSYPLRGKGKGLMPTLYEILTTFPNRSFLIDHKDNDKDSTKLLIKILKRFPQNQRKKLYYWGSPENLQLIQAQFPEIKQFFILRWQAKKYFVPFLLSFGIIKIPEKCKGLVIGAPVKYVKYFWGWSWRFINKIHKSGLKFYLMLDTKENAVKYRSLPVDGFVTDYIEVVGKDLK